MTNLPMNKLIDEVNNELSVAINKSVMDTQLEESMLYSLNAGGKRIRPVLLLLTLDSLNTEYELGMKSAIALEMIHTYSLIHDDLPAMDNDDYRRGKLTNHKVYGEWTAILAGDALLTKAFELISSDDRLTDEVKIKVLQRLSIASGHVGMVGGQMLDMQSEGQPIDLEILEMIHKTKTGALLTFAVMSAADIANVDDATKEHLESYSYHLGMMFQIKDDLLDCYGDEAKLGKKVGSDLENNKSTYVSLLGKDGAEDKLTYHRDAAVDELMQIDEQFNTKHLLEIVDLFYIRDH